MLLIKFLGPFVAVLWGYDFVQVDNDNYTMRRVHTERQEADLRIKELAEKVDALLRAKEAAK